MSVMRRLKAPDVLVLRKGDGLSPVHRKNQQVLSLSQQQASARTAWIEDLQTRVLDQEFGPPS